MEHNEEDEKVPVGQWVFDNLALFAVISLVISLVIYNLWGLMDLLSTPLLVP
jgi:hypothetical protein